MEREENRKGGDARQRRIVVALGMHRSGTSVLARGLQALGVDLGRDVLPVAEDNPRGFWENPAIVQLDDELLAAQGLRWDSACVIPASIAGREAFHERACDLVRSVAVGAPLFGFKDPRTARLLWFWQPVFGELGLRESYVLIVRNPEDVVASLRVRNDMPRMQGLLLWALHNLDALDATRGREIAVVDYDDLLAQPQAELRRLAETLGLALDAESGAAIESYAREFLTADLRHHHHDRDMPREEEPLSRSVFEMYRALRRVARGEMSLESDGMAAAFNPVHSFVASAATLLERAARGGDPATPGADEKPQGTWAARLDPRMPAALSADERAHIEVICTNEGTRTWTPDRPGGPSLRVCYHVRNQDGSMVLWDGERTPIPFHVEPGQTARFQAAFTTPIHPGDYLIEWDLVSEGDCWFQQVGSATAVVPLRVTAPEQVEPARYPIQAVSATAWSPRFQKPLEEVRVAIAVRSWNVIQHNRREVFERTLESLREAGHPFELFLVDNGSTDGTAELVAQRGGYLAPRVGEQNGAGHGMNVAIERALASKPDLVVFSDDDIDWHPGFLRRLVEFWAHAPHDIALISAFLEPRWYWNTIRGVVDCGTVRLYVRETASGGAWAFPASNWRWIGPLQPGMSADWDACCRLRRNGFRVGQADLATHIGAERSTWENAPPAGEVIGEAVRHAALERAVGERDVLVDRVSRALTERERELAALQARADRLHELIDGTQQRLAGLPIFGTPQPDSRPEAPLSPEQLLTLYGREFVVNAYRTLLRREPDPAGLEHHLELWRQGKSRHEIIRRMRNSPEGRQAAVDVRAIRIGIAMARLCELRVVGPFIQALAGFFAIPAREKERRAFEARIGEELERLRSDHRATLGQLAGIIETMARVGSAGRPAPDSALPAEPRRTGAD